MGALRCTTLNPRSLSTTDPALAEQGARSPRSGTWGVTVFFGHKAGEPFLTTDGKGVERSQYSPPPPGVFPRLLKFPPGYPLPPGALQCQRSPTDRCGPRLRRKWSMTSSVYGHQLASCPHLAHQRHSPLTRLLSFPFTLFPAPSLVPTLAILP